MKPVSRITSRMSVKVVPLKELNRLVPSAHFTFLLAGSWAAVRPSAAANAAKAVRLVMRPVAIMGFHTSREGQSHHRNDEASIGGAGREEFRARSGLWATSQQGPGQGSQLLRGFTSKDPATEKECRYGALLDWRRAGGSKCIFRRWTTKTSYDIDLLPARFHSPNGTAQVLRDGVYGFL